MSPANRFMVCGFDFDDYDVIVEAADAGEAIRKANALYEADGFGYTARHAAPALRLKAVLLEALS